MDAETRQLLGDISLRIGNLAQTVKARFNDVQLQISDLAQATKIGFDDVQDKVNHLIHLYRTTETEFAVVRLKQDRLEKRVTRLEKKR